MKKIVNMVDSLPNTEVFMVPSGTRDVHHTFIYPTPPFEESQQCNKIHMMTDPCIVNVDGISFGITSTDILFHMCKEEMAQPRAGDRFRRLASHLIQQQSFYPLYPPRYVFGFLNIKIFGEVVICGVCVEMHVIDKVFF